MHFVATKLIQMTAGVRCAAASSRMTGQRAKQRSRRTAARTMHCSSSIATCRVRDLRRRACCAASDNGTQFGRAGTGCWTKNRPQRASPRARHDCHCPAGRTPFLIRLRRPLATTLKRCCCVAGDVLRNRDAERCALLHHASRQKGSSLFRLSMLRAAVELRQQTQLGGSRP